VYTLIKSFVDLALLRIAPQDLPASPFLLQLLLALHALIGALHFMQGNDALTALIAGLSGTAVLAALTATLLYLNGLRQRLVQTLTALAGVDVVIGVLSLPLSGWLRRAAEASAQQPPATGDGAATILLLGLLLWNLGAAGHVLRHALSAPLAMGVVLALIFYVVSMTCLSLLLPGAL
jgi:hypothetical protein